MLRTGEIVLLREAQQLVTQCQMVSLEDMQTSNTQSEQVIFRNRGASICIDTYKQ